MAKDNKNNTDRTKGSGRKQDLGPTGLSTETTTGNYQLCNKYDAKVREAADFRTAQRG